MNLHMDKIVMFWGSNTGNQKEAAGFLKEYMESEVIEVDEYNIADTDPDKMLEYKNLIIGNIVCANVKLKDLVNDKNSIIEKIRLFCNSILGLGTVY